MTAEFQLVEKVFSTSAKNIGDIFWWGFASCCAHSLCSHTCTIEVNFPRHMSPENLIFTFSATAVAELCEALDFRIKRF